ncbi:acyl-CoA dehydrogenase family protein [Nocardia cyriacigeorgica]|uniref:acyl-CoA dehydrogenase family protein n=1 Tax=Nocardia cyriacigeorgica TaxID=135487 RepID=UPI002454A007|nr:acyl-CoA dehydrogenase family protein [Nocardia cyriacigeorgica]
MTITTDTHTTSASNLLKRIDGIGDLITSSQPEALRLRRATDQVVDALETTGLTRMTWPRERGGDQLSLVDQHVILTEIGRHDGSTAWLTAIWAATPWMIRLFGEEVFDEYLTSDNTRAGGVFSITGTATPTTGGYTVTGRWPFCSGQHHSGWMIVPAQSDHDGYPLALLVPRTAFDLAGEWTMSGLVGTGSNALSLTDAFIPQRHTIPFRYILDGIGRDYTPDPYWRQPLVPIISGLSAGPAIGMATTALTDFTDLISRRGITYSPHTKQSEAPITAFQLAEAQALLDTADYFGRRLASTVDEHIAGDLPWDTATRVRSRYDAARAVALCRQVCDIIDKASGATAHQHGTRLTTILDDIRALTVHSFLLATSAEEQYGRILAGLEPSYPIY